MARWKPGARDRLSRAAIDLFHEQGYSATTVPQIAARAGLTTRTFYRYFADKREVIFGVEQDPTAAQTLLERAPAGLDTAGLLAYGLGLLADGFDAYREQMRATRDIIASEPALQERGLRKRAMFTDALYAALRGRGLAENRARLLAETTVGALYLAIDQWLTTDTSERLDALTLRALAEIGADLDGIAAAEAANQAAPAAGPTP